MHDAAAYLSRILGSARKVRIIGHKLEVTFLVSSEPSFKIRPVGIGNINGNTCIYKLFSRELRTKESLNAGSVGRRFD